MFRGLWTKFRALTTKSRQSGLRVELLELRDCPSATTELFPTLTFPNGLRPLGTAGPTGMTPAQIRHAYGFDQLNLDGAGTTIAIVDAFDNPNIENDLKKFDQQFGLPDPPSFRKVNQNGGSDLPRANKGWGSEIALDVEWAHAIAPKANILLVEATLPTNAALYQGVRWAASQPGVVVVSMSFGGAESADQLQTDSSTFVTPAGHPGVTFIASSGDTGAPASYPSASPHVLSVGGTTLKLNGSNNISTESAWTGSGGGLSAFEAQPAFQHGIVTQSSTKRATPDVAYDADPNTGFPVYDSFNNGSAKPWSQFGGTSDAAPQWAGIIALANQGRFNIGLPTLDGINDVLPAIYQMPAANFHDIVSGGSTGTPKIAAGPGYDLVTGRGSPVGNLVVNSLIGQATSPTAASFVVGASASTVAGDPLSVTVTAVDSHGATVTGYTGAVKLNSSDPQATGLTTSYVTLPINYTFLPGDHGVHTFTVKLKTAGNQTLTATDTAFASITGTTGISVSPATATKLAFGQQPTTVVINNAISPSVTVRITDDYGNTIATDNTTLVTLALSNGPALGGSTTATASAGIATFANLVVSATGTYSLVATAGGLPGALASATSSTFSVTTSLSGNVVEDFETVHSFSVAGGTTPTATRGSAAAHDGRYGMVDRAGPDFVYRNDVIVNPGDTLSVWLKFAGAADGRAYFGFGTSSQGTLALVAAADTGKLLIESIDGLTGQYTDIATANQRYLANRWYRLEVNWSTTGAIIGKLYDANGTSLLNAVTATAQVSAIGGFGFRAIGSDKYWDTVTQQIGVNTFLSANVIATTTAGTTSYSLVTIWNSPTPTATPSTTKSSTTVVSSAPATTTKSENFFSTYLF